MHLISIYLKRPTTLIMFLQVCVVHSKFKLLLLRFQYDRKLGSLLIYPEVYVSGLRVSRFTYRIQEVLRSACDMLRSDA